MPVISNPWQRDARLPGANRGVPHIPATGSAWYRGSDAPLETHAMPVPSGPRTFVNHPGRNVSERMLKNQLHLDNLVNGAVQRDYYHQIVSRPGQLSGARFEDKIFGYNKATHTPMKPYGGATSTWPKSSDIIAPQEESAESHAMRLRVLSRTNSKK